MTERDLKSFDSEAGYRQLIDEIIPLATKEIRIFDGNLTGMALEEVDRVAALETFLAGGADRRLRIVVHDPEPLQKRMPRLAALMVRRNHAIEIRKAGDELRHLADRFVLADRVHGVIRFHADHARGKRVLNDANELTPWQQRFEDLWKSSSPCASATTIGL